MRAWQTRNYGEEFERSEAGVRQTGSGCCGRAWAWTAAEWRGCDSRALHYECGAASHEHPNSFCGELAGAAFFEDGDPRDFLDG